MPLFAEERIAEVHPDDAAARAILAGLATTVLSQRLDLVGVQGPRPGSGRQDGEFWEGGGWFAKSRTTLVFDALPAAHVRLSALAELKARLGSLTPARTLLVIVGREGPFQLWTVTPRMVTLRERLDAAARGARWQDFRRALVAFAHGLGAAVRLARDAALSLDANPANFADQGARLRYLDDDVAVSPRALGIEDAFVARFGEYPAAPGWVWEAYVERFADEAASVGRLALREMALAERLGWASQLRRGTDAWVSAAVQRMESHR